MDKGPESRVEQLSDTNYTTWSKQMQWFLTTKKLWTVVKLGFKPGTKATELANVTEENNNDALALIGLSVSPQHHDTVFSAETAKEAWDALAKLYAAKSFARKMLLRKQLFNLAKEPLESLTQYAARATSLRSQLAATGMTIPETEVCWALLTGLPDDYNMISTLLETSDEELEISDVLSKLQTVEQRLKQQQAHQMQEHALVARHRPAERVCWNCGRPGHLSKACFKKRQDDRAAAQQNLAAFCVAV